MEVKGITLLSRLDFILEKADEQQKAAINAKLSPEFSELVKTNQVSENQWYPGDYYIQIHRAIDQVLGNGDLQLLSEVGAYSAEIAVKGIVRLFFKFGSPEFTIKRSAAIWRQHYSEGIMTPIFHAPNSVTITLNAISGYQSEIGFTVQGWIKRVVELSGGKQVRVEIREFPPESSINVSYSITWKK
jgi:hypothetical protein